MGFLDYELKRGIRRGINQGISHGLSQAISGAVEQAITPAANQVAEKTITPVANQAAENINDAAQTYTQTLNQTSTPTTEQTVPIPGQEPQVSQGQASTTLGALGGLFASLQNAAISVANEAAKNMKVCPSCGEPATADKTFCPSCGTALPEQTAAESARCHECRMMLAPSSAPVAAPNYRNSAHRKKIFVVIAAKNFLTVSVSVHLAEPLSLNQKVSAPHVEPKVLPAPISAKNAGQNLRKEVNT